MSGGKRIVGTDGDDKLIGTECNDVIKGGAGNDHIDGRGGADHVYGGDGDDHIIGDARETMHGGDGRDTFDVEKGGKVYGGGDGGSDDVDTLDLRGLGNLYVKDVTPDDDGNGVNGWIQFLDENMQPIGERLDFYDIENFLKDPQPGDNRAPDAQDDSARTGEEMAVTIDVLDNDSDPDGDPLTVTSATTSSGSVRINDDGSLTFQPEPGFNGNVFIDYEISDGQGGTDTARVAVEVGCGKPGLDGIVEGTAAADLIDLDYTGDPEGDRIDAGDAILGDDAPDDDRVYGFEGDDTIKAGRGDDLVFGGEGDDTIFGEEGDDRLHGGAGDDTITGGLGNDKISGGDGDDVIEAGDGDRHADTARFDNPYPGLDRDPDPYDDRDVVYGGAGNDRISTGDDQDRIYGGSGNDRIDAGIDDDYVHGGDGDDYIVGGEGNDRIDGGAGNDTIYGGLDPRFPDALNIRDDQGDKVTDNGRDVIRGGDGDDVIFGQDDDDRIWGDAGNDTIDGGIDDDKIYGGTGNDTITGGQGADRLYGGDDRDSFIGGDAGDEVDGGSGGDDYDVLDLSGTDQVDRIVYTSDDREDGIVYFKDGSTMRFEEIENVVPCFTPGTLIATPRGERLVEELREGDRIITRDNGIQEIRWLGRKDLGPRHMLTSPHLQPVMIRAGALGGGLPERDMMVSPNHRLLLSGARAELYFGETEVLAAAKHLVGSRGIHRVDVSRTSYIHMLFDQHEVVLSNGAWTESFQPGDHTLNGIGETQRGEICGLFPELATPEGVQAYRAARKALKRHEAQLMVV
ncbi:Hint domain-containing protein [Limimaricola pyoseonensis]|uniref:Ca2+-binding protein, RTX toxin-related n=1 Tax=Limimaricola pyoseonensis TaxID=521013 RepID=A0A1G7A8J0_9RHOB|nr:Hint domain-containing protein [Limimaricola pyoseonensis]SDE10983.1 Ca2+-binding protein, RTX toxin-related [Limimaricola pyoseonensis]